MIMYAQKCLCTEVHAAADGSKPVGDPLDSQVEATCLNLATVQIMDTVQRQSWNRARRLG